MRAAEISARTNQRMVPGTISLGFYRWRSLAHDLDQLQSVICSRFLRCLEAQEAGALSHNHLERELAEEQANRAALYERIFGPDSDWVSGARLLNQFYETSAREQERQAHWHLELARQRADSEMDASKSP